MLQPVAMALVLALALPAALAAQERPAADVARDAARKPDAMVAFAGVKPGDTVADMIPGAGYFTRVFSRAVGPGGKVFAIIPAQAEAAYPEPSKAIRAMAGGGWPNVAVVSSPLDPAVVGKLDLFWTAQNYHDLHNSQTPEQVIAFNKAVFAALKPGGTYVIVDHAGRDGSGRTETKTLHRIDPAVIRSEAEAAGFRFDGESPALRNSADPRTANVFDPAIRGKTDQIAYRFRKP
ncbi:class I SAM-dependent methyltransferase [Polymorphobacter fuscus]|uniref:Methyltransferase n=1 Tax=Sandarakinorhabdus fusca TaxID=1439888 RepID=A0A7C9KI75_9SPHN|nr:class I SAM-dependent methyltransferase [Polymorphobacter fuscus]KAB7646246.1 class I SAM-dependent methyltransferase [Polymorphobacter fuscus]MQT17460.1 methyltransferase [Polymorphobacter fuscus]NJC10003.1 putative methyltransferase [Polymorphobacter fuscus]